MLKDDEERLNNYEYDLLWYTEDIYGNVRFFSQQGSKNMTSIKSKQKVIRKNKILGGTGMKKIKNKPKSLKMQ